MALSITELTDNRRWFRHLGESKRWLPIEGDDLQIAVELHDNSIVEQLLWDEANDRWTVTATNRATGASVTLHCPRNQQQQTSLRAIEQVKVA
jgi:hypothetical protein